VTARASSGEIVVTSAVRAAAAVFLLALGPAWLAADLGPLPADIPRDINLLKPPHDDVRIRWSATVSEEGGEFLISRQGTGGFSSVVARVRPRGDGRYSVAQRSSPGASTYKLRYRDRHGREYVLATIRLNVERVDPGHGILSPAGDGPPAAVRTAAVLPMPAALAGFPMNRGGTTAGVPAPPPPLPPP
jgi:hypothetical protein